ncbi:MAG: DMP19 family protein [Prevotellaceae bacterium]|nr:DMP19 family protein [Prevotellaceae bacterium]
MIHLDRNTVKTKHEELNGAELIRYITDEYLSAVGGSLTAEVMDMLSPDQHSLLCYRYVLDEVMEGGFIQLILNGYAPYVLEGPFPYTVKKEWGMKDFSKLLFSAKKEYHKNKELLSKDMDDDEFMALYEQLDDLNCLGDSFLDDYQETVTPAVVDMIMKNIDKYL